MYSFVEIVLLLLSGYSVKKKGYDYIVGFVAYISETESWSCI